jgi:hypothetical protein
MPSSTLKIGDRVIVYVSRRPDRRRLGYVAGLEHGWGALVRFDGENWHGLHFKHDVQLTATQEIIDAFPDLKNR